jgi:7,8-dihydropterin-6-yl-methyl-4-(beta-D-ribofuranosyl)aminobenzene 5'-phosphate synthase
MQRSLILATLALTACSTARPGPAPLADPGAGKADAPSESEQSKKKNATVDDFKITILSDMVTSRKSHAEWGFSALVEVQIGGTWKRLLFDTGGNPDTVLFNAAQMKIDLCDPAHPINNVILSHNHQDHVMGLVALRQACVSRNPDAMGTAYVGGEEIFWPRPCAKSDCGLAGNAPDDNVMALTEQAAYAAAGGTFVIADEATHLQGMPGVWLTGRIGTLGAQPGQIVRTHDEKTYPVTPQIQPPDGAAPVDDLIPEEQALVINTAAGLVVVTGCAHAGVINTLERATSVLPNPAGVLALVGGFHLFKRPMGNTTTEGTIAWEADQLAHYNLQYLLGAHCTGIERLMHLRTALGLTSDTAVVSTVETTFSKSGGIAGPSPGLNHSIPAN